MTKSKRQKELAKDRLRVWIDGACEPINPGGTASYGVIVKHGGEVLFSKGEVVSHGPEMSNNVGEYSGLIAFLNWYIATMKALASRQLTKRPVIYSDSRLLINQMTRSWRAKRGLYLPYYNKAANLIRQNNLDLSFWWIPRRQNREADRLSKDALLKAGIPLKIQPERSPKNTARAL